jgi:hypothetical protein
VRQQSAEDLTDVNAFDLAWIPTAFVPAAALPAILRRALRSGGWLLLGMVNPGVDPLAGSLARLRTALWGGALLIPTDVESMLGQAG